MRWRERTKVTQEECCQGIRRTSDKVFDIPSKTDNRFLWFFLRGSQGERPQWPEGEERGEPKRDKVPR